MNRLVIMAPLAGATWISSVALADVVVPDDQIVQGSTCVGLDCINNESFSFDTIRLKENNLRIHVEDTSSTSTFPSNDWRLVFNDTVNAGANYFALEDSTAARQIFRVEAGAPLNALFVAANGFIGAGTGVPSQSLHLTRGDSPAIRLDQDGSLLPAYVWDVGGNETNFFVRDASDSNKLPLRIRPGSPTNTLFLDANGNVGIGTDGPLAKLQVEGAVRASSFVTLSDANAKKDVQPVDGATVLAKLKAMPVTEWSFKGQDVRHVGPMAQDFRAAFGLGDDERTVALSDLAGVALAGVKQLEAELGKRDEALARKDAELREVKARLRRLEQLVERLGAVR